MVESTLSFLEEFRQTFRLVDAIDILLMSVFLYSALVWFKRTASRGVLLGVSLLAAVYFAARALDMYLTSFAFHTTFAVLLLILVVVFQEDLRRMFERLSAWRSLRLRQTPAVGPDVDTLVESAFKMGASRRGALIVLKGSEPLERHIDSGVLLGGRLSKPLLYSIFDTGSEGHDGAVIIDDDRVEQFAAYLPLSKNRKEIAGRGTRHSAALGLSERCDALTIVVSEERGVVSVAESGKLKEMASAADLKVRLERFLTSRFPETSQGTWMRLLTEHLQLKILALVVAIVAWFVLAYDPHTVQRTFIIPIEYRNLNEDLILDETAPDEARVTLSGSERSYRFLEPGTLKVSLDLSDATAGFQERLITDENIPLPSHLAVYRIEPGTIRLNLLERPLVAPKEGTAANGGNR